MFLNSHLENMLLKYQSVPWSKFEPGLPKHQCFYYNYAGDDFAPLALRANQYLSMKYNRIWITNNMEKAVN